MSGRARTYDNRAGVTIYGLDGTKRLLRLAAPDLKREMDKEIQTILKPVQRSARDNIDEVGDAPLPRWNQSVHRPGSQPSYTPYHKRWEYDRLEWNPGEAKRNIKIKQGGRRSRGARTTSAWSVRSDDPAAVVWELMGRGISNTNMVKTARRISGQTGRILYRAWDNSYAKQTAPRQIERVIREYEQRMQERLRSQV